MAYKLTITNNANSYDIAIKSADGTTIVDNSNVLSVNALPYLTTAPSSANTDGIKIVVLSSEPATKYNGYLYIITE